MRSLLTVAFVVTCVGTAPVRGLDHVPAEAGRQFWGTGDLGVVVAARPAVSEGQETPSIVMLASERLGPLLHHSPLPRFPSIAAAARVYTHVLVRLRFREDGQVAQVEILAGHPFLNAAAVDALRTWQVNPVVAKDQGPTAEGWVLLAFGLGAPTRPQFDAIGGAVEALFRCEALANGNDPASAVDACATAQASSAALAPALRAPIEQRARLGHGRGLILAARHREAVDVLRPALKIPTEAQAGRLLAQAQVGLGQFQDAARTCDKARAGFDAYRAQATGGTPERIELTALVKAVMLECADIFDKAGKPKDAENARKRATDLK